MKIGNKDFPLGQRTYVMGILNVTPDSFSDGGRYTELDQALAQAQKMAEEGADIIDIGGESTRPGYTAVSDEEEIGRVVPVIRELKKRLDIPLSVDTYKGNVAEAALAAGADMVNDIWGLGHDAKIGEVTAAYGAPICLMHNRKEADYGDFLKDWRSDLEKSIERAKAAGIGEDRIILDPGVGFAKTYEQNLLAIKYMASLKELGYPVLLGTSRKSVIGLTLDLPKEERIEGTLATSVLAVTEGIDFVRVHDVKENVRAIRMAEAILSSQA